jgi:hypothetical protein
MTTEPTTNIEATPEKKPRDPIAQGVHILNSYLQAVRVPTRASEQHGHLFVQAKANHLGEGEVWVDVNVVAGNIVDSMAAPTPVIQVPAEEITSYEFERAVYALWRVTEPTGYGTPLPVDRGEKTGRVSYLDEGGFELAYLRHTLFRRSPNKTEAELAPYMSIVKSASKRAFFRWNSIFVGMGFEPDDLVNVGRVYTISFLHHYAYEKDQTNQTRLLTAYLNQRYGEFAKICYKKAQNATCLPSQVKSGPIATSDDGEDVDYIDTYAEAETVAADEEYESGQYTVRIKTDTGFIEAKLEFRPAKMLGVDLYLNGSLLPKSQADAFREGLNAGRIQIVPDAPPPEIPDLLLTPAQEESAHDRRLRAREELHNKLNTMTQEEREHILGYAAFSRDFDPDARREARRLSEELICPKCLRKVPSGAVCLSCKVEARLRYGVDYMAYREKLKGQNHSLVDAMTAQIPDSEVRSRQKRAKVTDETPIVGSGPNEKAPEAPPSVMVLTPEQIKALSKQKADEFMASLPDELICPKCNAKKSKHDFGIRVPRDKTTGVPIRAVRQSYCKPCRKTQ